MTRTAKSPRLMLHTFEPSAIPVMVAYSAFFGCLPAVLLGLAYSVLFLRRRQQA